MEKTQKDKRKVLLVIPLLVLPFMALAFYALGGGKGITSTQTIVTKGINTALPDASFKTEDPKDKLGIYNLAGNDTTGGTKKIQGVADKLGFKAIEEDVQTAEINQKLEALNREITKSSPVKTQIHSSNPEQSVGIKTDVDRLESLMKSMQSGKEKDPEMEQLNTMLQSILDIQHPERLREKYDNKTVNSSDSLFKAIPAMIVDDQKAVQGATIKIRLLDSVIIKGIIIPKGHELFGTCKITNQRLLLDVKNIRLGNSIIPVDLSVYSLDGMVGIDAPEAQLTGALNSGADDAVRNIGIGSFDQSVATQVAGAGIDAARQLFSKKVKSIKVKLKAGRAILLRNNNLR